MLWNVNILFHKIHYNLPMLLGTATALLVGSLKVLTIPFAQILEDGM